MQTSYRTPVGISADALSQINRGPQRGEFVLNGGKMVETWGVEPQTYSLQSYRSTN